jgi:hypothetical protein
MSAAAPALDAASSSATTAMMPRFRAMEPSFSGVGMAAPLERLRLTRTYACRPDGVKLREGILIVDVVGRWLDPAEPLSVGLTYSPP